MKFYLLVRHAGPYVPVFPVQGNLQRYDAAWNKRFAAHSLTIDMERGAPRMGRLTVQEALDDIFMCRRDYPLHIAFDPVMPGGVQVVPAAADASLGRKLKEAEETLAEKNNQIDVLTERLARAEAALVPERSAGDPNSEPAIPAPDEEIVEDIEVDPDKKFEKAELEAMNLFVLQSIVTARGIKLFARQFKTKTSLVQALLKSQGP